MLQMINISGPSIVGLALPSFNQDKVYRCGDNPRRTNRFDVACISKDLTLSETLTISDTRLG